jgi:hypothetical protein
MPDEANHAACVDDWLERTTKALSPELVLQLFETALGALWRRSQVTLGDVTLTAIVDRVLYNAAERFPLFSSLKVEPSGVRWQELRERADSLHDSELRDGIRFVLVEFLTVLGSLTAEILTPELHANLSKVALGAEKGAPSKPMNPEHTEEEDTRS